MYCKHCKVEVETHLDICPLCHNRLEGKPLATPIFMERKARKFKKEVNFSDVYFFVAFIVVLTSVMLNVLAYKNYTWSALVFAFVVYVYLLIKNTIMYKGTGGSKIYAQTWMLLILSIMTQYIFKMEEWAFSYAMPSIIMLSLVVHAVLVSVFNKKARNYVRYMAMTALGGFIPAILLWCGAASNPYMAYSCLAMSAIALLGLIMFANKLVSSEISKKMHI